jgi:hypothetical protein
MSKLGGALEVCGQQGFQRGPLDVAERPARLGFFHDYLPI